MKESANFRPGEPLRSWLTETEVVESDAIFTVRMADAHDALTAIISGHPLRDEDLISLGRLNSYSVARWYEPVVTLMREAHISPEVAEFFKPLLPKTAPR